MAVHYTRERSKYGTLTGSIITWPVEVASATNPNNTINVQKLPAGYLRCDGSKYNANDYPLLAEICGTGTSCKFIKLDENDEPIITLGDDEFVVPDLGSKYPRPVSTADAGTFNNIIEQTQNNTFIERSGIGISATSNVGSIADVTYSGKFIVPSQTFSLKGKPSWEWGTAGKLDSESVESTQLHPHMHFSSTSRVRVKSKSGATGGVIQIPSILYDANDPALNGSYNGTAFTGFGSGTTEVGGFSSPGYGSGYVAFGGGYSSSLITTREWTISLNNTAGYTLIAITSIVGNDNNGGERPNNPGEGIYIVWPDGSKSTSPILPSRQESGLSLSLYDSQYANWITQTLAIPQQFQGTSPLTITFTQTVQSWSGELQEPYETAGTPAAGYANYYDMCGVVQVGLGGGFEDDPSLTDTGNDIPQGINYFKTASTIDVQAWLDATKASGPSNSTPGSGQPACWAIASGTLKGSEIQDVNPAVVASEVIQRYNFCNTGCELSTLKCYCLLKDSVNYDLTQDWFGIEGTRYNDYTDFLGSCGAFGFGTVDNAPWPNSGNAPATYVYPDSGMPIDWKGLPLDDVLPLNGLFLDSDVYPQARNVYSQVDEVDLDGDPTIHDHKITVVREDHQFKIVTDSALIEPDNLNTTLQLSPSSVASYDVATAPFIVLEYLIKT